jgi:hypothetical protein
MEEVFKKIDQYEKVEIKELRFKDTTDFYTIIYDGPSLFSCYGSFLNPAL